MSNKLRSGLSSLGIIIGVSSVIILLSIGAGQKKQLAESLGDMAANTVTIESNHYGRHTSKVARNLPLTPDTKAFLESTFSELSGKVYGQINIPEAKIQYGTKSANQELYGISLNYFDNTKAKFEYGSGFSQEERDQKKNVIVLGYNALEQLFANEDPIGKTVMIKGKIFTVTGILQKRSQDAWMGNYLIGYIPFSTASEKLSQQKEYEKMTITLPRGADNEQRRQMIHYSLLKYIGVQSKENAKFNVSSFASYVKEVEKYISGFSMFLGIIGGMSLLVGGIGVMNIMIVSVTERTREIGIRKAIGALRRDIITQFLIESILITFLSGLIAISLSQLIITLINKVNQGLSNGATILGGMLEGITLTMTTDVVIMAFGLTVFTGIFFGILPARKAMKLKPIDALRFE